MMKRIEKGVAASPGQSITMPPPPSSRQLPARCGRSARQLAERATEVQQAAPIAPAASTTSPDEDPVIARLIARVALTAQSGDGPVQERDAERSLADVESGESVGAARRESLGHRRHVVAQDVDPEPAGAGQGLGPSARPRLTQKSTRGGSRDTDENAVAVKPARSPASVRVVMTVTPAANRDSASRKLLGVQHPYTVGTAAPARAEACSTSARQSALSYPR